SSCRCWARACKRRPPRPATHRTPVQALAVRPDEGPVLGYYFGCEEESCASQRLRPRWLVIVVYPFFACNWLQTCEETVKSQTALETGAKKRRKPASFLTFRGFERGGCGVAATYVNISNGVIFASGGPCRAGVLHHPVGHPYAHRDVGD